MRISDSTTMIPNKTVGVIVLGDVGRSPRMQYHSYSLSREGFRVKLLGYNENKVSGDLVDGVEIVNIKRVPVLSEYDT